MTPLKLSWLIQVHKCMMALENRKHINNNSELPNESKALFTSLSQANSVIQSAALVFASLKPSKVPKQRLICIARVQNRPALSARVPHCHPTVKAGDDSKE